MSKVLSRLPLILLSLVVLRITVFGASIGDALSILALAGFAAFKLFIKEKREAPISEAITAELAEIKSSVNALKVARTLGR